MKNILLLILFVSFSSLAQNSKIELIKDKPKAKVDRIEDEPKLYVPRIDEPSETDLLPLRSKNYTPDELLEIKAKEPSPDDLLDLSFPKTNNMTPNAGQRIYESKDLGSTFTFDKKISYVVKSPEGNVASYFYFNTQDGTSLMDWEALKLSLQQEMDGEINNIMTASIDFYSYVKSSEGDFSMKISSGNDMVLHDLQTKMLSEDFFNNFKKTGKVVGKSTENPYPRVEYKGTIDGQTASFWLSDARDVLVDKDYTYALTGFSGLGFVVSPTGKTFMLTGVESAGTSIMMSKIENANMTFVGKNYKPMGEMVSQAMGQNMPDIDEGIKEMYADAASESDPELRALKLKQAAEAEKMLRKMESDQQEFVNTSDLTDLPNLNLSSDEDFIGDFYDINITSLESGIKANQLELQEIAKNGGNPSKSAQLKCVIVCGQNEKIRFEKLKQEHLILMQKYKQDTDKRDELVNQLMQRAAMDLGQCDC